MMMMVWKPRGCLSPAALVAFTLLSVLAAPARAYKSPVPDCDESTLEEQQAWCAAEGIEGEVRPFECGDGLGFPGPWECSPKCVEGVFLEPLTCLTAYGTPFGEEEPPSESASKPCRSTPPEDCPFELIGEYNFCGGRMYPAVIDDDDNLYFFTARGRLHSLDKRGKFRWRMDFCNAPPGHYGSMPQQSRTNLDYPLVMDYHGTLYFFIGDVLYGVSGDGEVLLQRRVLLPGIQPDPPLRRYRNDTDPEDTFNYEELVFGYSHLSSVRALTPVLDAEGRLYVGFTLEFGVWPGSPYTNKSMTGYAKLDRLGNVLSHYATYWGPLGPLIGDAQGRVVGFIQHGLDVEDEAPCERDYSSVGADKTYVVTYEPESGWTRQRVNWPISRWETYPVVGANGSRYAFSTQDRGTRPVRYGLDDKIVPLAPITYANTDGAQIKESNHVIVDRDGYMYVERDLGYSTGIGFIAFDPTKMEAEADPKVALLAQKDKGYLWGLDLPVIAMNYGSPVLTVAGNLYVPMANRIIALKLRPGGAEPEVLWKYAADGGVYPTAMHVLSDGTLVIGNVEGMLYFVKEKNIENGGLDPEAAWPRPYHDNYRSNNASHPIRWDRTKPAPYPSLKELLAKAPKDWNCNADTRCFPKSYHESCDWDVPTALASQEISCSDEEAVQIPCPDPRRYPCLAKQNVAEHPCDVEPKPVEPDEPKPANCNCATQGIGYSMTSSALAVLLLGLFGLTAALLRRRRH